MTVLLSILLGLITFAAAPNNGDWQGFGGYAQHANSPPKNLCGPSPVLANQ
jgi:hypothetical protein